MPGRTEDIASIEVVKGDKAVAVYGEEARNGIVVVTTTRARRR
jgi:TonB-dependent SusC/RagA subfamily outer membrane receptor